MAGGYLDVRAQLLMVERDCRAASQEQVVSVEGFATDLDSDGKVQDDHVDDGKPCVPRYCLPLYIVFNALVVKKVADPNVYVRVGLVYSRYQGLSRDDPLFDLLGSVMWDHNAVGTHVFTRGDLTLQTIRLK